MQRITVLAETEEAWVYVCAMSEREGIVPLVKNGSQKLMILDEVPPLLLELFARAGCTIIREGGVE